MRSVQRAKWFHSDVRRRVRFNRFWIGWLEAETTGDFDAAKHDLQDVQRTTGLETVRVRRNPAHRVEGHRTTDHLFVTLATEIGPRLINFDRFVKGGFSQKSRD